MKYQPGTVAILLARGCPDDHLERAHDILVNRRIPDTMEALLEQVDTCIALAAIEHRLQSQQTTHPDWDVT